MFREAVEAMLAGLMGGAGPGPRVQAAVLSASSEQAAVSRRARAAYLCLTCCAVLCSGL